MSIHEAEHLAKQKISDGVGPRYHRVYSVVVETSWERALEAMRRFQMNINEYSPQLMCRFEKTCGHPVELKAGDEFQIHITGPWNGPVRVKSVSPTNFTLMTLEGHMEAGEIEFRISKIHEGRVKFEIESIARSRDLIVDLVYDKIPIAKFAQTEMWKSVCRAMAKDLMAPDQHGPPEGEFEVGVLTERRDEDTGVWETV